MIELTLFGLAMAAVTGSTVRQGIFAINSNAFTDGESLPTKYAHQGIKGGMNISLPLQWSNPPAGTKSFALSIIDPHPVAKNWIHWMAINIPANATSIPEGASGRNMPAGTKELINSYSERGYGGPEPPKGSGVHPYVVTVYALNVDKLDLNDKTSLKDFEAALKGKTLGSATTTGMFEQ